MALITLEEFRRKRDQFALDGYYQRWPILSEKSKSLQQQMRMIDIRQKTWVMTESGKKQELEEKPILKKKYYEVLNEIAMIEADAPFRKMNLGLIPIPADIPDTVKFRLAIFQQNDFALLKKVLA